MSDDLKPYLIIQKLAEERRNLPDDQILAELASLPAPPDEDDPAWDNAASEREWPWILLDPYLAFCIVVRERKLRAALPLLLERAVYGDPGETMRGLCHTLEDIVYPDWNFLTEVCIEAAKFPQPGARLWSLFELGRLQDIKALTTLTNALQDEKQLIREQACTSLGMLCQTNDAADGPAIEALQRYSQNLPSGKEKDSALEEIEYIRSL